MADPGQQQQRAGLAAESALEMRPGSAAPRDDRPPPMMLTRSITRSFGDFDEKWATQVPKTDEESTKRKPNKAELMRLNRNTIVGIGLLVVFGVGCLIASVALFAVKLWEAGCFVLAVSLIALIPGVYYTVYVRRGLNQVPGYNLEKVPLWRSL